MDYAVARCPSLRQSVSLSVCHMPVFYQIGVSNHILKLFHLRVSTQFYLFHTKPYDNNPTGTPLTGALNAEGYEKIAFQPISHFISEMIQDTVIVSMEGK